MSPGRVGIGGYIEKMAGNWKEGKANRKEIYLYIIKYIKKHGYPPSNSEIADDIGVSATTVRRHIEELMQDGLLETDADPGTSRAIRVMGYGFGKIRRQQDE